MYGGIISRVVRIASKSQYTGDEAAAWFSTLLNKPGCKLYQIHEPRDSTQDTKWGNLALPGDKVRNNKSMYLTFNQVSLMPVSLPKGQLPGNLDVLPSTAGVPPYPGEEALKINNLNPRVSLLPALSCSRGCKE